MTPPKYRNRYYLFTSSKQHEDVQLDFPSANIELFIDLWRKGAGMETICKKLRINDIEFALIVLDLSTAGRIRQRKQGIHELKGRKA